jgi:CRP/FNR family cyclic AMP-dependent transcriptional regulator
VDPTPLLRSIPLFDGLTDEDLQALADALVPRACRAGTLIFDMGDEGSAMYIVETGDVNLHLPGEGSRRISLKDLGAGEYFGELALFDGKPRSAAALATTDTVLLELSRNQLEAYLERRPRAAMAILRTMGERLRETNTLLSARAARNVDAEFDRNLSWSDRLADSVAELNGSWKFILVLLLLTATWVAVNAGLFWSTPPDPYPFQLFNLALAILVGLQGPLIVMSQNRQGVKDRARAETDYQVNLKNEVNIETLVRELSEMREEMHQLAARESERDARLEARLPPRS